MVAAADPYPIWDKRKAIGVLFPYAIILERRGQQGALDTLSRAAMATNSEGFLWHHIKPFIMTLFNMPNPPSLNWILGFVSPRVVLQDQPYDDLVAWRTAAPSPTEEADRGVVNELLQIVFAASLRPRAVFPPGFSGLLEGAGGDVLRQVRALGDTRILKSYLLLVWSEWDYIGDRFGGLTEMRDSIQGDFGGIGMGRHREDLIKRLNRILGRLDSLLLEEAFHLRSSSTRRSTYLQRHAPGVDCDILTAKERYGGLKRLLLEVDGKAVKVLTRTFPRLIQFRPLTPADAYRISLDFRVRFASPVSMILHLERLALLTAINHFVCTLPYRHRSSHYFVPRPRFPDAHRTGKGNFCGDFLVALPNCLTQP